MTPKDYATRTRGIALIVISAPFLLVGLVGFSFAKSAGGVIALIVGLALVGLGTILVEKSAHRPPLE